MHLSALKEEVGKSSGKKRARGQESPNETHKKKRRHRTSYLQH